MIALAIPPAPLGLAPGDTRVGPGPLGPLHLRIELLQDLHAQALDLGTAVWHVDPARAKVEFDRCRAIAFALATLAGDTPARCRVCGCTDEYGCADGCWWMEADLCSQCAAESPT